MYRIIIIIIIKANRDLVLRLSVSFVHWGRDLRHPHYSLF